VYLVDYGFTSNKNGLQKIVTNLEITFENLYKIK